MVKCLRQITLPSYIKCITGFFLAILLLFLYNSFAYALPPPSSEEIEQYKKDGTLDERMQYAEELGTNETDPTLVKNYTARLSRLTSSAQKSSAIPTNYTNIMPSTGNVKVPVLIVDFSDSPYDIGLTNEQIRAKMFDQSDPNSMSSFYKTSSYNQLNISGDVFGIYRAQHTLAYYKEQAEIDPVGTRLAFVREVTAYFDSHGCDFSQYDANGDNYIDSIYFFWCGFSTGWGSTWSTYVARWYDEAYMPDGKKLKRYVMYSLNNVEGVMSGVLEHETGHLLGLPDYYSYDLYNEFDAPRGGLGQSDLMDSNSGDHNIFSKYLLGWISPQIVIGNAQSITIRPINSNPDGVIVMPNWGEDKYSEYFIIEHDDSYGLGLRIYHIDAKINEIGSDFLFNNSYTKHKLIRLMEADGFEHIESGIPADKNDYYQTGQEFSPDTYPNTDGYNGFFTGVFIKNIITNPTEASFDVDIVNIQENPNLLRSYPSNGMIGVDTGINIDIVFMNKVYCDVGLCNIELLDSDSLKVETQISINNNVMSIIPTTRLIMNQNYTLHIPSNAIRNALGNNLNTDTHLEFTTASGASVLVGEPQNISELQKYTRAEAIGKASDGVIITLSGQTNDRKQVYSILHIDNTGSIIGKKVFDSSESSTFTSNKKLEVLSTGCVFLYNNNYLSFFDVNLNKSWSKKFNPYACAFGLSDGSVGVFDKSVDGKSTVYTQYSENGNVLFQKTISNYKLCKVSKTPTGYVFVGFLESQFNKYDYVFIKLDNDLNIVSSKVKSFIDLPRTSGSNFQFPLTQFDDCLRLFRIWNKNNISIIKLDWDMNIINEYQLSNKAMLNTALKAVFNEDGSLYLCYPIKVKAIVTTNFSLMKVLANGNIEWSKNVYLDPSDVLEAGFIINDSIIEVLSTTLSPSYSFRFFDISGPNNNVTVSFNCMGGEAIDPVIAISGTTISAPEQPTKPGYKFVKWYKDEACTDEWVFGTDKATEDITLFAKWQEANYFVTFDPQGGNIRQEVSVGYYCLVSEPEQPIKAGYRFDGWFKEQTCIHKWIFNVDRVTSNITIYAKWLLTSLTRPSAVNAVPISYKSIKITWNSVTDASGYEIWVSSAATGAYRFSSSTATLSYVDNNLSTGKPYYYKVRAYLVDGSSKLYSEYSTYTTATPTLFAPQINATSNYRNIALSWNAVDGSDKYEIYRSSSKSGKYTLISSTTKTSFTNSNMTFNKTYFYKVRACRFENSKYTFGPFSTVLSIKTVLISPQKISSAARSYNSIKITWSSIPGAYKYEIHRATSLKGRYKSIRSTSSLSYINTGIATGVSYYYKVRAYRIDHGKKVYSNFSSIVTAKTTLSAPSYIKGSRLSTSSIKLNWGKVSGRTKYEIWRCNTISGSYILLEATTKDIYIDKKVKIQQPYYYKVRAYHLEGTKKVYGGFSIIKMIN